MAVVDVSNVRIDYVGPASPFTPQIGLNPSSTVTRVLVGGSWASTSSLAFWGSQNRQGVTVIATMPAAGTEFYLQNSATNVYKVSNVSFAQGDQLVFSFYLEIPILEE